MIKYIPLIMLLSFILHCPGKRIGASVKDISQPLLLGPVERIGGKRISETDKQLKRKIGTTVRHGEINLGRITLIYNDSPNAFGKSLLIKDTPSGSNFSHLSYIRTSNTYQCYFVIFCITPMGKIAGKGGIYE